VVPVTAGETPIRVEQAADFLGCSVRTMHERARLGQVPHRRPAHTRRLLFFTSELLEHLDGAELERRDLPGGGRIVRPR
jgi:hypothetical protein